MPFSLDGGMERGHAQILPPPGVRKVPGEGTNRMVRWCPRSKILKAHHVVTGGGMHQVSVGVHLDVSILRLSHPVSTHGIQQLVHGGG